MINQVPISLKLDPKSQEVLTDEIRVSGGKKNRIINRAVQEYIELLDVRRKIKTFGFTQDSRSVLYDFLRKHLPEAGRVLTDLF